MMTQNELLDLYFMEVRAKLLDVAAALDRVDRASGCGDFRLAALRAAIPLLDRKSADRAEALLDLWSDPTEDPITVSPGKGAVGAWQPEGSES
jgi:hypothetical protein